MTAAVDAVAEAIYYANRSRKTYSFALLRTDAQEVFRQSARSALELISGEVRHETLRKVWELHAPCRCTAQPCDVKVLLTEAQDVLEAESWAQA